MNRTWTVCRQYSPGRDVEPDEAVAVAQLFGWYLEPQATICQLARRLTGLGVATQGGKSRWSVATVRGTLRNPAYAGRALTNRTRGAPARQPRAAAPRGPDRGARPAGRLGETFARVQAKLDASQQWLPDAYLAKVVGLPELTRKRQLDATARQRLELTAVTDVRYRGRYCYVAAKLPGHREATPILRLRWQDDPDNWAIGICKASTGQYSETELPAPFGGAEGTPEQDIDETFVLHAGPGTGR